MSTLNVNTVNTTTINPTGGVEVLFGGSAPPKYAGSPVVTVSALPTATMPDAGNYYSGVGVGDQLQEIGAALTSIATSGTGSMANIVKAFYRMMNPVGKVAHGYWTSAPTGSLLLNGSLVSRTTYADLWAYASSNGLVVSEGAWAGGQFSMFGEGDGATTFRLPEFRGEWVRAADFGRGLSGIGVGGWNNGQPGSHSHNVSLILTNEAGAGAIGSGNPSSVEGALNVSTDSGGGAGDTAVRSISLTFVIYY